MNATLPMTAEITEYIEHRANDPWYQNYPEDYKVVRKLYDIFTCGDELYIYPRYDIMRDEIRNFIDLFIDDFEEKYSIICKFLDLYQIKILSFYYSDFIRYAKYWGYLKRLRKTKKIIIIITTTYID